MRDFEASEALDTREEDGKGRGTRRSKESKSREDVLHAREHMLGG